MKRTVALVAGLVFLLSACGYKASSGAVIEMTYTPEDSGYHFVTTTQCNYNPNTKSTQCMPVQQYQYYFYPECYKIRVEDVKKHRGSWCVNADVYNRTHVGDHFDAKAQNG